MVNDRRYIFEFPARRQARRIDDFVNGSIEANLWRVSKQPDERVVDISGIIRAFFVIASIGDPAQDLVSKDIIALY